MAAVTVSSDAVKAGVKIDGLKAGAVYCRSAKYTNSGAKDANSVVKMIPMPSGARIVRLDWKSSALGTGRTIDIGNATTVDAYVDGASVATAATGSAVLDTTLTAAEDIQIKVLGDTLPDEAVLSVHVYYKMAASIKDEA